MTEIFANQPAQLRDPVIFETDGHSMDAADEILTWLEGKPDCGPRHLAVCSDHGFWSRLAALSMKLVNTVTG